MAGLRSVIRAYLPSSWEYILKREKKLLEFIELVYQSQPKTYRGKYGWHRGKRNILARFKKNRIHEMIDYRICTNTSILYWYGINNQIKDYEYLCK